jgi:hypothetical protein
MAIKKELPHVVRNWTVVQYEYSSVVVGMTLLVTVPGQ